MQIRSTDFERASLAPLTARMTWLAFTGVNFFFHCLVALGLRPRFRTLRRPTLKGKPALPLFVIAFPQSLRNLKVPKTSLIPVVAHRGENLIFFYLRVI